MRTFALAMAALLLASACTDDPQPIEPEPSQKKSPSPTAPPQIELDTPEGSAAFVDYYIDLLNYAAATGDVEKLQALSSSECDGCNDYIRLYDDVYAAGGSFKGGLWAASDFELEVRKRTTDVFVHVRASEGQLQASASSSPRTEEAFAGDVVFEVNTRAADRQVQRFERLGR